MSVHHLGAVHLVIGQGGPKPRLRGRCAFKQSDVTRALKAAQAAGVKARVEIELGKVTLVPMDQQVSNNDQDNDEVERWLAKHAHRG